MITVNPNMSIEELKKARTSNYEEALVNDYFGILGEIASHLGTRTNCSYTKYQYCRDDLTIFDDRYGGYITVHKDSKLIASTHNEKLFIPGEWFESLMSREYPEVIRIKQEKQIAAKEKERQNLLDSLTI